jgi:hypothetical protein
MKQLMLQFLRHSGHFGERLVQPHGVARRLVSLRAQAHAQQGISKLTLRRAHVGQTNAVPHQVAVDVAPVPPYFAVDWKVDGPALGQIERGEERARGVCDRLYRNAGGPDGK